MPVQSVCITSNRFRPVHRDRKTGTRPSAPNHVLFSRQMPVDSHWTQTQPTDVSLCLRTSGRWRSVGEDQSHPDHPERFDSQVQVLCREGLTGRCYWEVERRGGVVIGVTYRGITRRGGGDDSMLGGNNKSWSLECYDDGYIAWYNRSSTPLPLPLRPSGSTRVGVYLDWPAGSLSFYRVSPGVGGSSHTLTLIHTFSTTFTQEDLLPGFRFWYGPGSSASLCGFVGSDPHLTSKHHQQQWAQLIYIMYIMYNHVLLNIDLAILLLYWLPIGDDQFSIVLITYWWWSVHYCIDYLLVMISSLLYWLPIGDDQFIIVLITYWWQSMWAERSGERAVERSGRNMVERQSGFQFKGQSGDFAPLQSAPMPAHNVS